MAHTRTYTKVHFETVLYKAHMIKLLPPKLIELSVVDMPLQWNTVNLIFFNFL